MLKPQVASYTVCVHDNPLPFYNNWYASTLWFFLQVCITPWLGADPGIDFHKGQSPRPPSIPNHNSWIATLSKHGTLKGVGLVPGLSQYYARGPPQLKPFHTWGHAQGGGMQL